MSDIPKPVKTPNLRKLFQNNPKYANLPFLTRDECSKCKRTCSVPAYMYGMSSTCYECDPDRWVAVFKEQADS